MTIAPAPSVDAAPAPPLCVVGDLRKSFGRVAAVDGISFAIHAGEVHGFIGPNGSGKTTTMRILAGVAQPDSGDVLVEGVSMVDYPEKVQPRIGFMPDYLDAYPNMRADDYLDFYARAYALPPARRRARLADVVEFTGLGPMLERPVEGLSKGWKQRLSLARVLLNDPRLLILDEPAAGLDPRARIELRRLVELLAAAGKGVFISSHILTELSEICRSVTIIDNGRLQATGPVGDLRVATGREYRIEVRLLGEDAGGGGRLSRFLAETPGLADVREIPGGATFACRSGPEFRSGLLARLVAAGFRITDFHSAATGLEDAFIALTGKR